MQGRGGGGVAVVEEFGGGARSVVRGSVERSWLRRGEAPYDIGWLLLVKRPGAPGQPASGSSQEVDG